MPEPAVTHNPAAGQFEIRTESGTGLLRYAHRDGHLDLIHTEVPESMKGRGYGAALATAALEYAKTEGLKVIPSCRFVASYIRRHPEHAALIAPR